MRWHQGQTGATKAKRRGTKATRRGSKAKKEGHYG
jgi:hypothetical protein